MRVPCVVRWPGSIPAGRVSAELVTLMDILPTFARLAEAPLPAGRIIDGRDIWPLWSGTAEARSPHEAFFYYHQAQLQAVRDARWKLYLPLAKKLVLGGGPPGPPRSNCTICRRTQAKRKTSPPSIPTSSGGCWNWPNGGRTWAMRAAPAGTTSGRAHHTTAAAVTAGARVGSGQSPKLQGGKDRPRDNDGLQGGRSRLPGGTCSGAGF